MSTLNEVLNTLDRFLNLPVGWDYGRDGPANPLAVIGAKGMASVLSSGGIKKFDAAPGRNGSVALVGMRNSEEVEMLCLPNGRYNIIVYDADDCEIYENRSLFQAIETLRGEGWLTEKLYTSCTLRGIYLVQADTQVQLSRTLAMGQGFRSYVPNVLPKAESQYVIICGNSASQEWPETHQYFGEYHVGRFQPELC